MALGRPYDASTSRVIRGQHASVPAGFVPVMEGLPSTTDLRFTVALKSPNNDKLIERLLEVSDPASDKYGQHLDQEEVDQLAAPHPEGLDAVNRWLMKNGVKAEASSSSGDMLTFVIPLGAANNLFHADFNAYAHEATNSVLARTLSYSLPAEVSEHVAFVYPTTHFVPPAARKSQFHEAVPPIVPSQRAGSKRATIPSQCAQKITPACLQAIYGIPSTPASAKGNLLGVSAFSNETANKDDLAAFLKQFRPDIKKGTFSLQSINGATDKGTGTLEASLDIQYTVGLATNVPTTFVDVAPSGKGDVQDFLDEINALAAMKNPPLVLTTSFGFDETPFLNDPAVAETMCNGYAKLSARGISVLFASGDGGVAGSRQNPACDGKAFIPTFPASCPYVTAVGSTKGINPETAADFSAGGFSNIFPRPAYQKSAVAGYLKTLGKTNQGRFNTTGRAYPDVATQGQNFIIEVGGKQSGVLGTSASSPTFASVVALLNDELLRAGKKPLGFLNPLLYSKGAAALTDIKSGSNPGCGTKGFPSVAGWDAVTGLGTPNFQKLLSIVKGGSK
ncbi:family S53 protease-like protein [Trametes polyzona]|nr:family S53 protease-like protein [Trametes polyzona]